MALDAMASFPTIGASIPDVVVDLPDVRRSRSPKIETTPCKGGDRQVSRERPHAKQIMGSPQYPNSVD